jgi:thymidylate kinase
MPDPSGPDREPGGQSAILIAVWGAAPGVGKSTASTGLARWLAEAGRQVDHFAEEELFTRPQFADVAAYFRATGKVEPAMLLAAASRFAGSVLAGHVDVVVADALVPFVPSLLAVGCTDQQIRQFVADLTAALAPIQPVLLFLDGDPATALARADSREGGGWLAWYLDKLARYGLIPEPGVLAPAATYLERERNVTLNATRQAGWRVITIERATEIPRAEVLRHAQDRLSQQFCL